MPMGRAIIRMPSFQPTCPTNAPIRSVRRRRQDPDRIRAEEVQGRTLAFFCADATDPRRARQTETEAAAAGTAKDLCTAEGDSEAAPGCSPGLTTAPAWRDRILSDNDQSTGPTKRARHLAVTSTCGLICLVAATVIGVAQTFDGVYGG